MRQKQEYSVRATLISNGNHMGRIGRNGLVMIAMEKAIRALFRRPEDSVGTGSPRSPVRPSILDGQIRTGAGHSDAHPNSIDPLPPKPLSHDFVRVGAPHVAHGPTLDFRI
jgi:hypothetical protein